MFEWLAIVIGLTVRLLIPLLATALLVAWLKRLDDHWQQETERAAQLAKPARPCWEVRNCAPAQRLSCPAYLQANTPCWQCKRDKRGYLPAACLQCAVFKQAPVAVPRHS